MELLGSILTGLAFTVIGGGLVYLYVRNFVLAIKAIKTGDIRIINGARIVGIFMPFVGVVLGFV